MGRRLWWTKAGLGKGEKAQDTRTLESNTFDKEKEEEVVESKTFDKEKEGSMMEAGGHEEIAEEAEGEWSEIRVQTPSDHLKAWRMSCWKRWSKLPNQSMHCSCPQISLRAVGMCIQVTNERYWRCYMIQR